VNLTAAELLGETRSSLINKNFNKYIVRNEREILYLHLAQLWETKQQQTCELTISKKGGTEFFGKVVGTLVLDENDKIISCRAVLSDITERKQAEQALKESEERFRSLLDTVQSVSVQSYALDGTIQYWNKASEHLYGYSAQEAIGRNLVDLIIPPEMRGDVLNAIHQMAETRQPIPASELILMRKDGSRVAVYSNHAIVQIPGRPPELFCIDIDISERKQLEDALLENQHRYEKSQALGHVGNWDYNLESKLFWVSDETKRIYGFNLDSNNFSIELVENCIPERERVHQALIDLIAHDKKYDLEFEIIPFDKTPRKTIHSIAELERDATNNPLRVRGVILDITERKKAEDILKTSEERFRSIINYSSSPLSVKDGEGYYLLVNPKFEDPLVLKARKL